MIGVREIPSNPRRIAIFRALQLGDLLQAIPAIRAIRAGFPGAEITLIGLPWAKSFTQRFRHYIDRFVEFVGFPGITEVEVIPERIAGFIEEQSAKLLNCQNYDLRLEFPICDQDRSEAVTLLSRLPRQNRPWIGLHAGARPSSRRWPVQYFASLADELTQKFNAQIILTGSADEKVIVRSVEAHMKTRPLNLSGETSLGSLAALINELDLFVSNDTGPAHIANALDTPSITIFGPADYRRWAPLDQVRHPIVRRSVQCSPCSYSDCPIDHRCLRWIHPEMVMSVAERLLVGGTVSCGV